MNKEQLLEALKHGCYNYNDYEILLNNAKNSVEEVISGKCKNFEIAGVKVSGYSPETKLFDVKF